MAKYPDIAWLKINTVEQPKISAQNIVFTVPTVCVFFDSKEYTRQGRIIDIKALNDKLQILANKNK